MSNILLYALQVLQVLPQLIAAGQDVAGFIQQANTSLKNMQDQKRDPTAEEWAALNTQIDALRKQLHEGELQAADSKDPAK